MDTLAMVLQAISNIKEEDYENAYKILCERLC